MTTALEFKCDACKDWFWISREGIKTDIKYRIEIHPIMHFEYLPSEKKYSWKGTSKYRYIYLCGKCAVNKKEILSNLEPETFRKSEHIKTTASTQGEDQTILESATTKAKHFDKVSEEPKVRVSEDTKLLVGAIVFIAVMLFAYYAEIWWLVGSQTFFILYFILFKGGGGSGPDSAGSDVS